MKVDLNESLEKKYGLSESQEDIDDYFDANEYKHDSYMVTPRELANPHDDDKYSYITSMASKDEDDPDYDGSYTTKTTKRYDYDYDESLKDGIVSTKKNKYNKPPVGGEINPYPNGKKPRGPIIENEIDDILDDDELFNEVYEKLGADKLINTIQEKIGYDEFNEIIRDIARKEFITDESLNEDIVSDEERELIKLRGWFEKYYLRDWKEDVRVDLIKRALDDHLKGINPSEEERHAIFHEADRLSIALSEVKYKHTSDDEIKALYDDRDEIYR